MAQSCCTSPAASQPAELQQCHCCQQGATEQRRAAAHSTMQQAGKLAGPTRWRLLQSHSTLLQAFPPTSHPTRDTPLTLGLLAAPRALLKQRRHTPAVQRPTGIQHQLRQGGGCSRGATNHGACSAAAKCSCLTTGTPAAASAARHASAADALPVQTQKPTWVAQTYACMQPGSRSSSCWQSTSSVRMMACGAGEGECKPRQIVGKRTACCSAVKDCATSQTSCSYPQPALHN